MVGHQTFSDKCPTNYHFALTIKSTYMIPIDYKITNFLILFCLLFKRLFLGAHLILISGKPVSQYASYSLIFSPLHSVINREQHEKYLYNQSSHSGKYGMFDRWSACLIYQFRVGVSGVLLCFISLLVIRTCWTAFQAKNNVRSTPAGFALTLVWHQSHKAHTTNRHLRTKGERNGVQRRTKVSLIELWCEHWSYCSWRKSTSLDKATLSSEEIKAV